MKTRIQNLYFLLITLFCFVLFSANVTAQQTKKISLQGFLKDANGKAVADGSQEIIFKLYTVATGGSAAWTDTQTINVYGGVYSTHLGSIANPLDGLNWGSETYFVGVTVQGTELSPRTELTFAPYSLGSPKAQEVVCSGAVGDVKYSILDPTQFAAQNGNCWIPMDGRSITGSKLATITGLTSVTNAGGLFLRGQEFAGQTSDHDPNRTSSSPIATMEDQAMQTHTHPLGTGSTNNTGSHAHEIVLNLSNGTASANISGLGGFYPSGNGSRNTSTPMIAASDRNEGSTHPFDIGTAGSHSHNLSGDTSNNSGFSAAETRPKNLNLWTYIRIN